MNPSQILVSTFTTDSLPFAAYLVASGTLRLLDVDASNPRSANFIFADDQQQGSQLEQSYLSGQAMVSASLYHSALRRLRRAIDTKSSTSTGRNSGQSSTSSTRSQQSHLRGNNEHANSRSR